MTAVTTFDTLKFVRRLEQVGVPSEQAEAQAEVLTEAFNVNLEELVTKDYLAAQFAEQKAFMDTRFVEERSYIDRRLAEERTHTDKRFAEINANFRTLYWILTIVVAATVVPSLERLIT